MLRRRRRASQSVKGRAITLLLVSIAMITVLFVSDLWQAEQEQGEDLPGNFAGPESSAANDITDSAITGMDYNSINNADDGVYNNASDDTDGLTYKIIIDETLIPAFVYRVIDGDTLVLTDGERVRLIGVDAPEMGFFGGTYEAGATEATEFVRELLPQGTQVRLESVGADRDRFGRLRRYVWLIPTDTPWNNWHRQTKTLNGLLFEYGHAVVWP